MEDLTFGERLTLIRNRRNLSKKELSDLTGIHWTNISKYEHNRSMPSLEILKKIASSLEASADYLIFGIKIPEFKDKDFLALAEKSDNLPDKDREFIKGMIRSYLDNRKD